MPRREQARPQGASPARRRRGGASGRSAAARSGRARRPAPAARRRRRRRRPPCDGRRRRAAPRRAPIAVAVPALDDAPCRRRGTRLARARAPPGRSARQDGTVSRRAGACRERDRVGMGAPQEGKVDDAPDHLIIPEPGGPRGPREPRPLRQIAVGVHVDDVGDPARPTAARRAARSRAAPSRRRRSPPPRRCGSAPRATGPRRGPAWCRGTRASSRPTCRRTRRCAGIRGHLGEVDLVERKHLRAATPSPAGGRPSIET